MPFITLHIYRHSAAPDSFFSHYICTAQLSVVILTGVDENCPEGWCRWGRWRWTVIPTLHTRPPIYPDDGRKNHNWTQIIGLPSNNKNYAFSMIPLSWLYCQYSSSHKYPIYTDLLGLVERKHFHLKGHWNIRLPAKNSLFSKLPP